MSNSLTEKQLLNICKTPIELLYTLEKFDFISEFTPLQKIPKPYHYKIQVIQNLKYNKNPDKDELIESLLLIKNKITNYKEFLRVLIDVNDTDQDIINYISKMPAKEFQDLQQISQKFFPFTHKLIQKYLSTKNLVKEFSSLNYSQILEKQDEYRDLINLAKSFNVLMPKAAQEFLQATINNSNLLNNQTIQNEFDYFIKQLKDSNDILAFNNIKNSQPSTLILNKLTIDQLKLITSFKSNLPAFCELKTIAQNMINEKERQSSTKDQLVDKTYTQLQLDADAIIDNWIQFACFNNNWQIDFDKLKLEQQIINDSHIKVTINPNSKWILKSYVDEKIKQSLNEKIEDHIKEQTTNNICAEINTNCTILVDNTPYITCTIDLNDNDFINNNLINLSYSEIFVNQNSFKNINNIKIPKNAPEITFYAKLNFLKTITNQDFLPPELYCKLSDKNEAYINIVNFYRNLKKQITSIDPIYLHSIFHNNPTNTTLLENTIKKLNHNELQFLAEQSLHLGYKHYAQNIINQNKENIPSDSGNIPSDSGNILPVVASAALLVSILKLLTNKKPAKNKSKTKQQQTKQQQEPQQQEEEQLINNTTKYANT